MTATTPAEPPTSPASEAPTHQLNAALSESPTQALITPSAKVRTGAALARSSPSLPDGRTGGGRARIVAGLALTLGVALAAVVWWTISVFSIDGWWLLSEQLAWRFTPRWAALIALLVIVLALLSVHWLARLSAPRHGRPHRTELYRMTDAERATRIAEFRRFGVKGFVMGADGRVSTSKVQVALWSAALLFGLLMLLLVGRTPNCPVDPATSFGSCPANPMAGVSFADQLGRDFRWEYLLLLGWPVAVAIAAKERVLQTLDDVEKRKWEEARRNGVEPSPLRAGSAEAAGTGTWADIKTPPTDPAVMGVASGLRELVADDKGRGALLDLQYLGFTLLTMGYFVLQLVTHPRDGLPEIPAALLVLMGIAGGGYLSGKVLDATGAKTNRDQAPPPPFTPGTSEAV